MVGVMKICFQYLGCKVNQYDTEVLREQFRAAGWTVTETAEDADVLVVNSCTVTAESDRKTRQTVRRLKRRAPGAIVVLSGCMPQAYPEKATELTEADIVADNRAPEKVLHLVEQYLEDRQRIVDVAPHDRRNELFEETPIESFGGRTRAFIKIQDGCNRFCSYCIIPTARGRSRSRSLESIEAELKNIRAAGYREVVLVGINFCCYGLDIGKSFVDPIELACSLGFDRVRIGSLEFDNITEEAIDRLAQLPNFCPQFHMSLQSGCDTTLKRMHRHYTCAEYEAMCHKLRASFEDAVITTDIMTGFPLETEEDFQESLAFAKKIGFEKIHVFPYSPREGTKAAELQPQVPKAVKDERCRRMIAVGNDIRRAFLERQIGRTVTVLCETYEDGIVSGYTENYTPVRFPAPRSLHNEMVRVNITGVDFPAGTDREACTGTLAPDIQL